MFSLRRARSRFAVTLVASLALAFGVSTADARAAGVPIVDAAKKGDAAAVRTLIYQHANVNAAESDGSTALHWAVYRDDVQLVEMLLRAGANSRAANRYGVTPLYPASVNGNAEVIRMLLKAGADPNTVLPEGETVLMSAARTGDAESVKLLLDADANANAQEEWRGQTALMWAAAEGHPEVIRELVARGADVSTRSKVVYVPAEAQFRQSEEQQGGFTALLFAAREGKIESVKALLKAGANLNDTLVVISPKGIQPEPGLNAFLLATGNAHYELAAWLLDQGVDANMAPLGWTALHQLAWVRKPGDVGHAPPAPEGSGNMTSFEFVRVLLEHGADINARATARKSPIGAGMNMTGATPFLMAARTKDSDYMRLLAELGADTRTGNQDNTTPLMVAAGVGMSAAEDGETEGELLEAIETTLDLGSDINAADKNGETAMHGAAYKLMPSAVQLLAAKGARIEVWNQPNKKGQTPLDIVLKNYDNVGALETEAALRELMRRAEAKTP